MTSGPLACARMFSDPVTDSPQVDDATNQQLLQRFHSQQDEAAFATLVRRYGALVLGVCRRVLADRHDADDAFQATFLVLVRKAGTIAQPELLGNWLYGVAYRTARKAQAQATRRRAHERQAPAMARSDPSSEIARGELRTLLDRELHRLPEKYRAPLVLCYLEGMTHEEAAQRLGWPTGSMSARLARGREMLRQRLGHVHYALPAGVLPPLLALKAAISLPAPLAEATVEAAMALAGATGAAAGAMISPSVLSLMEKTLKSLASCRRKRKLLSLLLVLFLFLGAGALAYGGWQGMTGGRAAGAARRVSGASATTAVPASANKPACRCH